jgi:putative DNA primase/helicase
MAHSRPTLQLIVDRAVPTPDRPPAFSEDDLALRFVDRHLRDLRYVAEWHKWMSFDGARWSPDKTIRAFARVREICREIASECPDPSRRSALVAAKTVGAVTTLARSDQRIAAVIDQWDGDPWLLNTPAGAVDLKTGELRAHRPEDYTTKLTGAAPDASCLTPLFLDFLDRIFGGDKDLIAFVQRVAGYVLAGSTREHAMFFCYGTGANGKSTFLNAITAAVGDYHRTAPIETFTDSKSDRHPTELAGLQGARLVTAVETEEGRRWAESKLKALTGGDAIAARFMRQDFFEYTPQFKLLIAGNHKPGLRSVDEAIRRRLYLIPFAVTIPPEDRDPSLSDKLVAELPGILTWMIEGCLAWQQTGLKPPTAVTAATANYLEAEDAIAAWIEECCERNPKWWTSSTELYMNWQQWAQRSGEQPGSLKYFSQRLEKRPGLEFKRKEDGRGFYGLCLNSSGQWRQ